MANEYVNELEINGQKRLDLTQDTATPETVLEGETFHLRSGAIETGTYRPSDEIEARLEATVGHSGKNVFEITAETATSRGVTFTVDKQAGTVTTSGTATDGSAIFVMNIPSGLSGDYYLSGCAEGGTSSTYYIEGRDLTTGGKLPSWEGGNSVNCYDLYQSRKITIPQGHECALRIVFARNVNADGLVFKPMIRDGRIKDDSLEPYVTPTDEKKQDKPVVLWEGDVTTNLTVNIGDNSYYSHYILTGISSVKTDPYAEALAPAIFTVIIHSDMPGSYCAPFYDVYAILTVSYQSSQGVTNMVIDNPKNITLNKIIGIPK